MMELMELIELKQLMELTEFMELLESWLLLWIGNMTELIELMEPLELAEWKEEMTCTDGLVGVDGNSKATGIEGIETV